MKKIILILLAVTLMVSFTGCAKKSEMAMIDGDAFTAYVDVSKIAENKDFFANRITSTDEQKFFQDRILTIIEEKVNTGEISNFEVEFSDETFSSWNECNDYAQDMAVGKSYLGSSDHYYLWNAQRLLNKEISWTELFKECKIVTVAFSDEDWLGSCRISLRCIPTGKLKANQWKVIDSNHASLHHDTWQAFVVYAS